jgi:hypothetical protein
VRFQLGKKLLMTAVAVMFMALGTGRAEAASGVIMTTPGSFTLVQGNTISVDIHENSGSNAVNAVQMSLSYTPGAIEVVSVDGTGSAFDGQSAGSAGGGVVTISRSKSGASLTGDQTVAHVIVKAVGLGWTNMTLTSGSLTSSDNQANVLVTSNGTTMATICVTTPRPGGVASTTTVSPAPASEPTETPAAPVPTSSSATDSGAGAGSGDGSATSSLPDTGATSVGAGAMGLGALGFTARAWYRSRRSLRQSFNRK